MYENTNMHEYVTEATQSCYYEGGKHFETFQHHPIFCCAAGSKLFFSGNEFHREKEREKKT